MRCPLALLVVLMCVAGCGPKADADSSASANASKPLDDPLRAPYEVGKDATEWLMNTKHTLRGLSLEEGNGLCQELLKLGAVEMRVDDVQPDKNDSSFESAGRMIVRGPRNSDQRKAILEYAAKFNGDPAPKSFDAEYAELRFLKK